MFYITLDFNICVISVCEVLRVNVFSMSHNGKYMLRLLLWAKTTYHNKYVTCWTWFTWMLGLCVLC